MKKFVNKGYCIGFVSDRGLMLDLDNTTLQKAKQIAQTLMETHKLEGYILIKTSEHNYHVVFNRYIDCWKCITKILFNQYICIRWAIWQAKKGELTLRISRKNKENKPKIIEKHGETDKLIKDYLDIYRQFEAY